MYQVPKGLVKTQIFALYPQKFLFSKLGAGSGNMIFYQVLRWFCSSGYHHTLGNISIELDNKVNQTQLSTSNSWGNLSFNISKWSPNSFPSISFIMFKHQNIYFESPWNVTSVCFSCFSTYSNTFIIFLIAVCIAWSTVIYSPTSIFNDRILDARLKTTINYFHFVLWHSYT